MLHFNSRECHVSCNSMSLTHHHFPCSSLMFATFHLYISPHHPYQYHLRLSSLFTVISCHYLTMTAIVYIDCHFLPLFCSYIKALYHSIFSLCSGLIKQGYVFFYLRLLSYTKWQITLFFGVKSTQNLPNSLTCFITMSSYIDIP